MKRNIKTYWTVKTPVTNLYYRNYENAKRASMYDYHDAPVKHTVKESTYDKVSAFFED